MKYVLAIALAVFCGAFTIDACFTGNVACGRRINDSTRCRLFPYKCKLDLNINYEEVPIALCFGFQNNVDTACATVPGLPTCNPNERCNDPTNYICGKQADTMDPTKSKCRTFTSACDLRTYNCQQQHKTYNQNQNLNQNNVFVDFAQTTMQQCVGIAITPRTCSP